MSAVNKSLCTDGVLKEASELSTDTGEQQRHLDIKVGCGVKTIGSEDPFVFLRKSISQ